MAKMVLVTSYQDGNPLVIGPFDSKEDAVAHAKRTGTAGYISALTAAALKQTDR